MEVMSKKHKEKKPREPWKMPLALKWLLIFLTIVATLSLYAGLCVFAGLWMYNHLHWDGTGIALGMVVINGVSFCCTLAYFVHTDC